MTIQEAMQFFGSQNKIAKAFGVTPPAVRRWRDKGRFPPLRALQLPDVVERWKAAQNGSGEVLRQG